MTRNLDKNDILRQIVCMLAKRLLHVKEESEGNHHHSNLPFFLERTKTQTEQLEPTTLYNASSVCKAPHKKHQIPTKKWSLQTLLKEYV